MRFLSATFAMLCGGRLVLPDCYHDRDWKVALVDKKPYWADVESNGIPRSLLFDYCLYQEAQSCIPCSYITTNKVVFPKDLLPCTITTSNGVQLANSTVMLSSHERESVDKTTIFVNPPQVVLSIKCGGVE